MRDRERFIVESERQINKYRDRDRRTETDGQRQTDRDRQIEVDFLSSCSIQWTKTWNFELKYALFYGPA